MQTAKQLYLQTFGCQMNVSDSEKIASLLAGEGYALTDDSNAADLIIYNTCSVRAKAEERVYKQLVQLKALKRRNPSLLLGVGGCVAQQEGERLLEKIPHLDLVFGTHNLHRLPQIVRAAEEGRRLAEVDFIDSETRVGLFPVDERAGGVTRFVTVMQGCDNFCSYCIVPYVRGREVSRRSVDILAEIRQMAANGVKEVTLLGQNVNSYGMTSPDEPDFAGLLRQVSGVEGIERIRFTTSHPKDFTPALIDCFAELPKLCAHIHLPAQSGSDAVLNKMNRGYTRNSYMSTVLALRAANPDIAITGDMIVGFPGETEDDFNATLSLMEEVRYSDLFSFIYSSRPGTTAAEMTELLTFEEKRERLDRLVDLQKRITRQQNVAEVGSRREILVERESKRPGQLFGRTSANRGVNFAGPLSLIGSVACVEITEGYQNSLLGKLAV
jgi:tRNA-2-methylthio-N6-dimethylallyladenosine synthase